MKMSVQNLYALCMYVLQRMRYNQELCQQQGTYKMLRSVICCLTLPYLSTYTRSFMVKFKYSFSEKAKSQKSLYIIFRYQQNSAQAGCCWTTTCQKFLRLHQTLQKCCIALSMLCYTSFCNQLVRIYEVFWSTKYYLLPSHFISYSERTSNLSAKREFKLRKHKRCNSTVCVWNPFWRCTAHKSS